MTDASAPSAAPDQAPPPVAPAPEPSPAAPKPEPAATAAEGELSAGQGAEGAARRRALRALAVALPLGALGAALVLFAMSKTWTRGTAFAAGHQVSVHATGSQSTALPGALALVGLAALVAVFAVRRFARHVVSGLLALSGAGVIALALSRRGDHGAVDAAAQRAASLTHATASHVSGTSWPLVAVAGGLLLLIAGLLALRHGSRWPAMSSRYDRAGGERPAPRRRAPAPLDPDRPEDLWKALDRGEDPTAPASR
ncbi:TIGR02234 family membrane protein [Streptomyces sp. NBC_01190]|uniref:TIGR02234 family membrane protein n=1 Tax=Streptomyces sp. NBC_01190 TaxID=2903767 RepID=UPI00386E5C46|nr:TIGR02234 family membrane protein [Streptomyces sp. NBC_01190]